MLRSIRRTPRFKRDYKNVIRKHYDEALFVGAIEALMTEDAQLLATRYSDHELKGEWKGFRELHITGDWLLIYRVERDELELVLTRTGSHDELLGH